MSELKQQMIDRRILGMTTSKYFSGENLGIVIASFIQDDPDFEDAIVDEDVGWKEGVCEAVDSILDEAIQELHREWNTRAQDAEAKRLREALERIADPKSLDCANWLTIDQIREFAREALKGSE